MAAVLACGPDAVLSHDSAAALWGVRKWPTVPEVTAPHGHRRPGIRGADGKTIICSTFVTDWGAGTRTRTRGTKTPRAANYTTPQCIH
jgi:hypothetical protein